MGEMWCKECLRSDPTQLMVEKRDGERNVIRMGMGDLFRFDAAAWMEGWMWVDGDFLLANSRTFSIQVIQPNY